MGKRRRKSNTRSTKLSAHELSERAEGRKRSVSGRHRAAARGSRRWLETHGRDLRFLLVFGVLMGAYYIATTASKVKDDFFPWYLRVTTQASAGVLHACGYDDMTVQGNVIGSPQGSITVERGCDAIAPTALFLSAVIASPVPWVLKLPAVLGGTLVLMVLNLIRIITLFLTRVHWPKAFDVMHLDIWQAAFIFLAILLWAFWASWATQRQTSVSDVAA